MRDSRREVAWKRVALLSTRRRAKPATIIITDIEGISNMPIPNDGSDRLTPEEVRGLTPSIFKSGETPPRSIMLVADNQRGREWRVVL